MAMLNHPFFKLNRHPRGAIAVIYLLLLALLMLDALVLLSARNAYIVIRIYLTIPAETAAYIDGGLLIGGFIAMFIHLVASERTLTDLDYPRRVLVAVGRVAGIQLTVLAVLRIVMISLIPALSAQVWFLAITVGALGAGVALIVISVRHDDRRKLR